MPTLASEGATGSPYVGPRPFTGDDRAAFFGRDAEVDRLVSEVIASPTLVIYAVSGAGKTSLLAAGLRPALRHEGFDTLPTVRLGGLTPRSGAANVFTSMTLQSLAQSRVGSPNEHWPTDPDVTIAGALAAVGPGTDEHGFPRPRALVFDQFEELFALHPEHWRDRKAFFGQVSAALVQEPELRVVFALREEYLAQFGEYAGDLPRVRFHLERLRYDAALRAATGPLEATGREFASGVAERLVHDLRQTKVDIGGEEGTIVVEGEFVEPLHLQVVCRRLWEGMSADAAVISDEDLDVFGNVDEALTSYYEDAMTRAAAASRRPEHKLRSSLERLFITSAGTRALVFAPAAEDELTAAAIAELERLHLVRTESRSGAAWLELAHDRLIDPVLRSNQRALSARRRVVGRGLAGAAVILAAGLGVLLSQIISTSTPSAAVARAYAAERAAQLQSDRTSQVSVQWISDYNSGYDARAARLMTRFITVSFGKVKPSRHGATGRLITAWSRQQPAALYLATHACWLGKQPVLASSQGPYARWIADPSKGRGHLRGCRPGPLWLLTITVTDGKVSGLERSNLGSPVAGRPDAAVATGGALTISKRKASSTPAPGQSGSTLRSQPHSSGAGSGPSAPGSATSQSVTTPVLSTAPGAGKPSSATTTPSPTTTTAATQTSGSSSGSSTTATTFTIVTTTNPSAG